MLFLISSDWQPWLSHWVTLLANELSQLLERTVASWLRWLIVQFPNSFAGPTCIAGLLFVLRFHPSYMSISPALGHWPTPSVQLPGCKWLITNKGAPQEATWCRASSCTYYAGQPPQTRFGRWLNRVTINPYLNLSLDITRRLSRPGAELLSSLVWSTPRYTSPFLILVRPLPRAFFRFWYFTHDQLSSFRVGIVPNYDDSISETRHLAGRELGPIL